MKKILYFSAQWCGPCKALGPIMDNLKIEGLPINKIDVDSDPIISANYSIKSIPTLVLVDNSGRELKRLQGSKSADEIKNWFNN
jgi:thioredoxin-like negative regulator of GroEL|tara:strand:+ start:1210 stop:1461 length:252 start_codon:yes stop_codon:yes gene_type:complete